MNVILRMREREREREREGPEEKGFGRRYRE